MSNDFAINKNVTKSNHSYDEFEKSEKNIRSGFGSSLPRKPENIAGVSYIHHKKSESVDTIRHSIRQLKLRYADIALEVLIPDNDKSADGYSLEKMPFIKKINTISKELGDINPSVELSADITNDISVIRHENEILNILCQHYIRNGESESQAKNKAIEKFEQKCMTIKKHARDKSKESSFSDHILNYAKDTRQLKLDYIKVALSILKDDDSNDFYGKLEATMDLEFKKNSLKNPTSLENLPISNAEYDSIKHCKKEVMDVLTQFYKEQGMSAKLAKDNAKREFKQASIRLLNTAEWNIQKSQFDYLGCKFISESIPAGQLKLEQGEHDIFPTSYKNGGVCSADSGNSQHAVNLWVSNFSLQKNGRPEILLKGIRHASLGPHSVKISKEDSQLIALERGREVVLAALFQHPEKLQKALNGETVDLQLTSTSLLTAQDFLKDTEGTQLAIQMGAWKTLSESKPLVLYIRDEKGKQQEVKMNLQLAAFNFGVNSMAFLPIFPNGFGIPKNKSWEVSNQYNEPSMKLMLGDNLDVFDPGGWVGNYLVNTKNKPDDNNIKLVKELSRQLIEMWNDKSYSNKIDPYKFVRRIVLLSNAIGVTPCWNCKSGKDRTALLDIEVKRELASLHFNHSLSPSRELSADGKALYKMVALNSSNLQIQAVNMHTEGSKAFDKIKNVAVKRVDDTNLVKQLRGLAPYNR
ncbi:Inositol phosphate phosphatase sopB [Yersinia nurmii]|uniref:Inositol phosphate phosphatase sopB n=1 Tax=Yersinia nurmii TaxID=685706 RepID=A0ABM9SLD5_9GAMM|nr:inositol phosphate phosphatase SopB [Yersinia nurmii]CNF02271.1 Inositol phosphate phosphatase sopB [Yersinia nurmii]